MKRLLVLSVILIIGLGLKMQSHQQGNGPLIVGGYSPVDVKNLSDNQKQIDSYLKSTFPQLTSLQLTNAQTQVVSGMNYKYTYTDQTNNNSYQYVVWDQPWMNNRQITQVKMVKKYTNQNGDQVTATKTLIPNKGQFIQAVQNLFQ